MLTDCLTKNGFIWQQNILPMILSELEIIEEIKSPMINFLMTIFCWQFCREILIPKKYSIVILQFLGSGKKAKKNVCGERLRRVVFIDILCSVRQDISDGTSACGCLRFGSSSYFSISSWIGFILSWQLGNRECWIGQRGSHLLNRWLMKSPYADFVASSSDMQWHW